MAVVLLWIILSILVAGYAGSKGYSSVLLFLFSSLFSPLLGALVVVLIPDNRSKECPLCKEKVKREALKCKHCGYEIETVKEIQFEKGQKYCPKCNKTYSNDWEVCLSCGCRLKVA